MTAKEYLKKEHEDIWNKLENSIMLTEYDVIEAMEGFAKQSTQPQEVRDDIRLVVVKDGIAFTSYFDTDGLRDLIVQANSLDEIKDAMGILFKHKVHHMIRNNQWVYKEIK